MSGEMMATIATGTRAESDAAFSALVSLWQGPLTGYAYRLLRSWDDAEDIFQSVMLTVFQHSGNFREIRTTKQGVSGEMSTIVDTEIGVFRAFCTQPFRCVRKASRTADNPATIRVT